MAAIVCSRNYWLSRLGCFRPAVDIRDEDGIIRTFANVRMAPLDRAGNEVVTELNIAFVTSEAEPTEVFARFLIGYSGYAVRQHDGQVYRWNSWETFADAHQLADCIIVVDTSVMCIQLVWPDDGCVMYSRASWVRWRPPTILLAIVVQTLGQRIQEQEARLKSLIAVRDEYKEKMLAHEHDHERHVMYAIAYKKRHHMCDDYAERLMPTRRALARLGATCRALRDAAMKFEWRPAITFRYGDAAEYSSNARTCGGEDGQGSSTRNRIGGRVL